jgi:flavin reductase (DIM6/NTAB) family NADH-FMN oxidoreductase RutF
LAKQLGFTHGREVDKFKKFRISKMRAKKVKAPLIKGSFAHMECKVITSLSAANYVIYLAEVVAHRVDPKLAPVTWFNNKYFAPAQQVF